ncbi:hypothetical protein HK104_007600 [Borealophlyctis nickersoniae]|nr:hypothetical protein HK104_007600 [Borealophlyctis nickersoniae]
MTPSQAAAELQSSVSERQCRDRLCAIRDHLLSLRRVPAQPNNDLARRWDEVTEIVKRLNARRAQGEDAAGSGEEEEKADERDKVDELLEDVVPLFVQFWSQSGKVSEQMYPTFVQLSRTNHQLRNLQQTGLYNGATLETYRKRIQQLGEQVQSFGVRAEGAAARGRYEQGLALLRSKLQTCESNLSILSTSLHSIAPALIPVYDRLIELKEELLSILARKSPHAFSLSEIQLIQDELRSIDSVRIDGKFIGKDETVLSGQAAVISLMEECYDDVHELLAARDAIGGNNPLRPIYEQLIRIKARLERMVLTIRWTMGRGEKLVAIQRELGDIDNLRVDGKFLDEQGNVPEGQAILHFLLHKCYRMVYKLVSTAEPVDESLIPIYNQLTTLKNCLSELVRWRVSLTSAEMIPYQLRFAGFDNLVHHQRVDGKFLDANGNCPEGQGVLHQLMAQCYELIQDLGASAISVEHQAG